MPLEILQKSQKNIHHRTNVSICSTKKNVKNYLTCSIYRACPIFCKAVDHFMEYVQVPFGKKDNFVVRQIHSTNYIPKTANSKYSDFLNWNSSKPTTEITSNLHVTLNYKILKKKKKIKTLYKVMYSHTP